MVNNSIAIIGGSGFIGTELCKKLHECGYNFKILDLKVSKLFPSKTHVVDLRNYIELKECLLDVKIVINLAAEHKDDVKPIYLYDQVNVEGARLVCRICDELKIGKIIFTSSVAVYGFPSKVTDESGSFNFFNDYGRTKLEAEKVYENWYKSGEDKSLFVLRPTVVFGPGNRGNVYNLLSQIASGKFIMVGDGENKKSMVYLDNVVSLLYKALDVDGYFVTNAVDNPDFTMNQLVSKINKTMGREEKVGLRLPYGFGLMVGYVFDFLAKISGQKFTISSIRIQKFCSSTQFTSNSYSKIGFVPPVSLEEGLKTTIEHEFLNKENCVHV